MGQYYRPVLIGKRGGVKFLYSWDYDNGQKLMAHSYIGNNFVNAVLSQILHHPMRIAWMGDYALDDWNRSEPYKTKMPECDFRYLYHRIWNLGDGTFKENRYKIHPEPLSMSNVSDFSGWYLVNHTQKTYINLNTYTERNKWREHWKDWRTGKEGEDDACIHPLPLLTACGNGRGGGDYYASHPDYDQIGTWAFDLIEFTDCKPAGYNETSYHFTEQEEV